MRLLLDHPTRGAALGSSHLSSRASRKNRWGHSWGPRMVPSASPVRLPCGSPVGPKGKESNSLLLLFALQRYGYMTNAKTS